MDSIIIKGGSVLKGEIEVSGAKNASLPILAATLLTDKPVILHNIPNLTDVTNMLFLLENHGASINYSPEKKLVEVRAANINNFKADYEMVRKMRASIWGCTIGARQIDMHLELLNKMGADIEIQNGYIYANTSQRLRGVTFTFDKLSVGATITGILAAVLCEGEMLLSNCAKEPEIIDLCNCLKKMGAKISNVGSDQLNISGVTELTGASHTVIPDRIEAGTYMIAAAITKGDLLIKNVIHHHLEHLISKLIDTGIDIKKEGDNLRVSYKDVLHSVDINTEPYPGFATDLQAQFTSLMTIADGVSSVRENIHENRFMHIHELNRMNADIAINGNIALIKGVKNLSGAKVIASDLRASACLVLAGLIADGITEVSRVYHLDRGYEKLEQKLSNCGADIERIKSNI